MIYDDVHTSHCCVVHGCKYSDPHCTVVENNLPITGCERCGLEEEGYYDHEPDEDGMLRERVEWPGRWGTTSPRPDFGRPT
jgi:hypothetical protein